MDEVVKGTPVSDERLAQFNSLVTFFDAKTSMDRIDTYAKWIFASSAVVGALGVGLANGVVAKAHGMSLILFVVAIACLGVSLVAACRSIAPQEVEIELNQLESMRRAVNEQFATREAHLRTATTFYAVALLLAAMVPITSTLLPSHAAKLTYSIDAKGLMNGDASVDGVRKDEAIMLEVERQGAPLAVAAVLPGASGDQTLHTGPVTIDPGGVTYLILWEKSARDAAWTELERISIQR